MNPSWVFAAEPIGFADGRQKGELVTLRLYQSDLREALDLGHFVAIDCEPMDLNRTVTGRASSNGPRATATRV
jgi:hypothetical protein